MGDGDLRFSIILVGKAHAVDRKFWGHFFCSLNSKRQADCPLALPQKLNVAF